MPPFYFDDWLTLYGGDCREVLASLPADSVDCVVTSPPYWGLRDYGTATWEGGDAECDHKPPDGSHTSRLEGGKATQESAKLYRNRCGKCGATRIDSQLGLERTPEEYVANMVAVFREVRRVLKPSGTCWLNLGDSYAGSGKGAFGTTEARDAYRPKVKETYVPTRAESPLAGNTPDGLKPKDLVGIPWRVAFALQADGWFLRSDVIWSKPNPMPESVTDRPTKSHEYLFLLTKSARYYFDADAVREANSPLTIEVQSHYKNPSPRKHKHADHFGYKGGDSLRVNGSPAAVNGRNIRSVWTIATRPYPGAHFAVFPPELPERCIKAGSSERGVCPECGAPWERVVERTVENRIARVGHVNRDRNDSGASVNADRTYTTLGWRPTCDHAAGPPHPAVVLDPFGGSGTVGMVANRLSRRAILIDLNPEYLKQQMKRNAQTPLGI